MSRQGWFVLTDAQVSIMTTFELDSYITVVDNRNCVSDWYSIASQLADLLDATLYDENPSNDATDEQYATVYSDAEFMYYSTESHTWFPAL